MNYYYSTVTATQVIQLHPQENMSTMWGRHLLYVTLECWVSVRGKVKENMTIYKINFLLLSALYTICYTSTR